MQCANNLTYSSIRKCATVYITIAYYDVIDEYGIWPFSRKTKSPRDDDDVLSPDDSN